MSKLVRTGVVLALLYTATAGAQDIVYDHLGSCPAPASNAPLPRGCVQAFEKRFRPGEEFSVMITNTSSKVFKYEIKGFAAEQETKVPPRSGTLSASPNDTVILKATHATAFGGYIVSISAIDGATGAAVAPATLIITVATRARPYSFGGGISVSSVRSPAFVINQRVTPGVGTAPPDTASIVATDNSRRDAATVGLATFLSTSLGGVIGERFDPLSVVVGIGLESAGSTSYYFGLGFALHDGIGINTGYTLGRVKTLPSGLRVGDEVSDANALQNLGTRSAGGWFVGMSFSFLGGGSAEFGKPFAGAKQ